MKLIRNHKGFSLIELMIALVIGTIALASIYGMYRAQLKAHATQEAVVDIQQNLRTAMFYMQKSIRMVGYDPNPVGAGAGFVADFSSFPDHTASGATTGSSSIAFTLDQDEDGAIDHDIDGSPPDDNINNELFAYRLNNNNLQVWREDPSNPGIWNWQVVAENIDAIDFVYLDQDNNTIPNPAANLANIRGVQITIQGRPAQDLTALADDKGPQILTTQIGCRNIGLP
ncbi:MAG: prepilin-type N-terminal cleavage/methylation domain-containing protein [Desulfobacterales bacterium]|nr:MAG: prepilin-type N-terminal cleavage/methylation domain-containing protein [Desulfobacterales bacterium]